MQIAFQYRPKKAIAAISFIASKNLPELTKEKMDKLLFLAGKRYLVQNGRTITGDWYAALKHGPIPSNTDNLLDALESGSAGYPDLAELCQEVDLDRRFQYPRIVSRGVGQIITHQPSESDIEALEAIIADFGQKSFLELRAITHETPAYEKAWETKNGQSATMRFEDFFEEDEDALSGVKEETIENCALRSAFPEPVWE
jgi:uncharacterized phage-associated protein